MNHHFFKVCAATPKLAIGDCHYNTEQIITCIREAAKQKVGLIVFPELCITGYTCADLFFQSTLLEETKESVKRILKESHAHDMLIVIGAPIGYEDNLYNTALVILKGELLGIVPKTYLPNYGEFYEKRWFHSAHDIQETTITYCGFIVPFSPYILFKSKDIDYFTLGVEICEDLWAIMPPSLYHALSGATVLVNPSASNEIVGKESYRRDLIASQSARTMCAYIYTSSGIYESTTDLAFSGHRLIYENGYKIAESQLFERDNSLLYGIIDLERIYKERMKQNNFKHSSLLKQLGYQTIEFTLQPPSFELDRFVDPHPFVPKDKRMRHARCKQIFAIQAHSLARRMEHTKSESLVLGISGGLDSTLALLVCVKAVAILGKSPEQIIGVTMPGFGTTDRTYNNALNLMKYLGVTMKEISIVPSVKQHLLDIEHPIEQHNVTYENAQARERTQILMDLSNKYNGIVVGTGDLSELALGWATYNGDHMSMYGVNASIPKTLVRYLIDYVAQEESKQEVKDILLDILATPVSPELLPPDEKGEIAQITEDIVGPYEIHDFYLYYVLRCGYSPSKNYYLAKQAFKGIYDDATLLKWLKTFYRRFFTQQFKRSCLPDGPKVGSVCLSPRGDWRMPSDASSRIWLDECERLSEEFSK
ncbi:NAD(+) synthase [Sporanaerobium hydrogeniformans]|uniref:NAD(+) synthase n=1 Tax=Sporanaerobium hydrogeniformans TaxID=3072179 RepID=A0AC61DBQ5_9FIRM|nr:NAD(+) synthase [Sporanaerobium hydrogeniformans]PHV70739.1 NAD(+) synthase [Sporanaerobium hydrogeniformans]